MSKSVILRPSYWASVSGGKDSLYMLMLILQNRDKYPLDGVVHYELEIDYPFIKSVVDYMELQCQRYGIRFVRIQPDRKWIDLYNEYGYPNRLCRWCNSKYKLNANKRLQTFLRSQGCFLISYIGFCYDETSRLKYVDSKDGVPLFIYPLVDFKIEEDTILDWAKYQPIFNDYYKYNRRCGCLCCPCSSYDNLAYTKRYYPTEYKFYMDLARKSEVETAKRYGFDSFSVWQSKHQYNTNYVDKKVDELISKQILDECQIKLF